MFDILILGGGMAGVSLAATLGNDARVLLIEVDDHLGRHATGRSAAMFFESYGNATIRALTRASRDFLLKPPEGFTQAPLMTRRDAMFVAGRAQLPDLATLLAAPDQPTVRHIDVSEALDRVPILRREWLCGAAIDESGYDIDVATLLQGYATSARRAGVEFLIGKPLESVVRRGDGWDVTVDGSSFSARILVNAAGAWADSVATTIGVRPLSLKPLRRSAVTVAPSDDLFIADWPLVIDVAERFYFKPDAGQLLISPANEDEDAACDAAPDELDVAIAIDRFEKATTLSVTRIAHRWAGLRTFAPDRTPVVGFDPVMPNFFWLAGQGGYGIQTAPAMALLARALLLGQPLPDALSSHGVSADHVSPARFDALA